MILVKEEKTASERTNDIRRGHSVQHESSDAFGKHLRVDSSSQGTALSMIIMLLRLDIEQTNSLGETKKMGLVISQRSADAIPVIGKIFAP